MGDMFFLMSAGDGMITPTGVTAIIGAMAAFAGVLIGRGTRSVKLEDGSEVALKERFITRAEHEAFRQEVRADFHKLEGMQQRTFDRVDQKHLELLQTMESAVKNGLNGRVQLWDALKKETEQRTACERTIGERVAKVEASQDVSREIGRLLDTLTKPQAAKTNGR